MSGREPARWRRRPSRFDAASYAVQLGMERECTAHRRDPVPCGAHVVIDEREYRRRCRRDSGIPCTRSTGTTFEEIADPWILDAPALDHERRVVYRGIVDYEHFECVPVRLLMTQVIEQR